MSNAEKYLKPEVVNQIKRLDLRAQFIVKGFLSGLHASPFHGFSVEFSEHRKYTHGDDPKDIDWLVSHVPVSYTHLTLPTICSVQISVVAVSLKKKTRQQVHSYQR
eukprot:TRINITY_DN11652_c0_g1_i1.p2 TRINITY_DN11652_c0_g1~~TRINITY_DN11652_c0_g1_i1.p2  ORF type:complete len:106 (-),score=8.78 TRINITY_DN11652_c0_g1_i1:63-380(-)